MNKKQIEQEFQKSIMKLDTISPSTLHIHQMLLEGESYYCLPRYVWLMCWKRKRKKDKHKEKLHVALYETMMSNYYSWDES